MPLRATAAISPACWRGAPSVLLRGGLEKRLEIINFLSLDGRGMR
jgi:hypothetical protein